MSMSMSRCECGCEVRDVGEAMVMATVRKLEGGFWYWKRGFGGRFLKRKVWD